jgi:predicted TIM-barrel fold metal-dependent hydrolase
VRSDREGEYLKAAIRMRVLIVQLSRENVVDAHHHLIDTRRIDYPWIDQPSPVLKALLANYYDIAHDYDAGSYLGDVGDEPPDAAVACEFGAADGPLKLALRSEAPTQQDRRALLSAQ